MSNWSNSLLEYSLDLITYGNIFTYDDENNKVEHIEKKLDQK